VQREEADLRQEFESKQAKAANLENYKKQLALMEESFGAMRRQLPDSTEVADLLVDVSQTGLAAGLEFELFQPQAEVPKDFYAELPIKIRVIGNYHEFGEFVSGLAALPRIVTIHDVQIQPRPNSPGDLIMEATARTYRYLDEAGG
jgi:type IV pilus assembly protein PilO